MQKIKVNINNFRNDTIDLIVDYLKHGKVIICPTDTIYGLSCLATDEKAIGKVRKIKERDKNKPFLVLVSSLTMVKRYCKINKKQYQYLKKVWPGPVTVVLKNKGKLPRALTAGQDSVAVRLPKSNFLCTIIRRVGLPIISTSINISGEKNIVNLADIEKYCKKFKPDLVIDGGRTIRKTPSKLMDISDINNIKVLRN